MENQVNEAEQKAEHRRLINEFGPKLFNFIADADIPVSVVIELAIILAAQGMVSVSENMEDLKGHRAVSHECMDYNLDRVAALAAWVKKS